MKKYKVRSGSIADLVISNRVAIALVIMCIMAMLGASHLTQLDLMDMGV